MRRLTIGLGVVLVAIGARELVNGASLASLRATAVWLLGGTLLHDGVLVPVTLLAGLGLTRLIPAGYRGLVQGALIVSGTVTLAMIPLLSGQGRIAANPSQQPLSYGRNVLLVLAAVWFVTALLALRRRRQLRMPAPTG